MSATKIGPILVGGRDGAGTSKLNSSLYAGSGEFPTIQSAVTYAVSLSGNFEVLITAMYTGNESISAITGGSSAVVLIDDRGGPRNPYIWYNGQYIPDPASLPGISTGQIDHIVYVDSASPHTTIQGAVNSTAGYSAGIEIVILPGYTGSESIGAITGGRSNVYISDQRTDSWQNYLWNGTNYVASTDDFQGAITVGQLNHLIYVDSVSPYTTIQGAVNSTAGYSTGVEIVILPGYKGSESIGAITGGRSAVYITDQRTESWQNYVWNGTNYVASAVPGQIGYPPPGIAVSTGSNWGTSLDPNNSFLPLAGGTLTGTLSFDDASGYLSAINPNSNWLNFEADSAFSFTTTNNNVNMLQMGRFATSTSPDSIQALVPLTLAKDPVDKLEAATKQYVDGKTANVAYTNVANDFTASQYFTGTFVEMSMNNGNQPLTSGQYGTRFGWNAAGNNESDFVSGANGGSNGGFNWYVEPNGGTAINPSTLAAMTLDSLGTLSCHGSGSFGSARVWLGDRAIGGWNTGSPNINSDGQSIIINCHSGNGVYFNWDQAGQTFFGNGAQAAVAHVDQSGNIFSNGNIGLMGLISINPAGSTTVSPNALRISYNYGDSSYFDTLGPTTSAWGQMIIRTITGDGTQSQNVAIFTYSQTSLSGNLNVSGTISGTTKNFHINHPLDETKYLTHSAVEGPECAVFYRGEGETVDGSAEITLPDYFEALTMLTQRTVQLTLRLDEGDPEQFAYLATTPVVAGKFTVLSNQKNNPVKFYWEVKAVRSDVLPLDVETSKETSVEPSKKPAKEAHGEAGTDRTGATKA